VRCPADEDLFECGEAAGVDGGAGFVSEVADRLVSCPGGAVDACADEGVVDVADGEDACLEVELVGVKAARVAAAVEAFVVVSDEASDCWRKTAELRE